MKKANYHPDLQRYYSTGKMIARLLHTQRGMKIFNLLGNLAKGMKLNGLNNDTVHIPSQHGGPNIRTRIFSPKGVTDPLPGFLFLHGGGYAVGQPEHYLGFIKELMDTRPCVVVAPEYRKSLKHPYPAGLHDCYDVLHWMHSEGHMYGIADCPLMVGGNSAGGGLTAAVSLMARDKGDVPIAFQMPLYPMIDHRQQTQSARSMTDTPVWDAHNNTLAWHLYLRDLKDQTIPAYASPALATHFEGLPPTLSFVGELEPFRDETVAYVKALRAAQVPVQFHQYPQAFHGFDITAPKAGITQEAYAFLFSAFGEYYDKYMLKKIITRSASSRR